MEGVPNQPTPPPPGSGEPPKGPVLIGLKGVVVREFFLSASNKPLKF